ncbi:hypothetical protein C7D74_33055, partial [Klebsiella pneumoniae]
PAAEALSDARYSWQVDGMDCAACARKVETAVRQCPGSVRSRCATESAPAAEALSDARYSWQVDGMDCAACARKV